MAANAVTQQIAETQKEKEEKTIKEMEKKET